MEIDSALTLKRKEWKSAKSLHFKLSFENEKLEKIYSQFHEVSTLFHTMKSNLCLDPSKLPTFQIKKYFKVFFFARDSLGNFHRSLTKSDETIEGFGEYICRSESEFTQNFH